MSEVPSFNDESTQSTVKKSNTNNNKTPQRAQDNIEIPQKQVQSLSQVKNANMSGKAVTMEELAAMGQVIGATLVAANQMQETEVKQYKAKLYNLFDGIEPRMVDYGVAAYFMVNDPSPQTQWGSAPPITISGKTVRATEVVGGAIPVSVGDGILRKFLSTAYEEIAPDVVKYVPGVAVHLNARTAKHGMVGVSPLVGVSWVKGVTSGTAASGGARAMLRKRAVEQVKTVADHVMPVAEVDSSSGGNTGSEVRQYY